MSGEKRKKKVRALSDELLALQEEERTAKTPVSTRKSLEGLVVAHDAHRKFVTEAVVNRLMKLAAELERLKEILARFESNASDRLVLGREKKVRLVDVSVEDVGEEKPAVEGEKR